MVEFERHPNLKLSHQWMRWNLKKYCFNFKKKLNLLIIKLNKMYSNGLGSGLFSNAFLRKVSKYFCVTINFWHMRALIILIVMFTFSAIKNEQSFCQSLTKCDPSWVTNFFMFDLLSSLSVDVVKIYGLFFKLKFIWKKLKLLLKRNGVILVGFISMDRYFEFQCQRRRKAARINE